jgi:hypothetical protein
MKAPILAALAALGGGVLALILLLIGNGTPVEGDDDYSG